MTSNPCPCGGERTHEKGACRDCGDRPCAYCDALATRRWSPPELAGYWVSVCHTHYQAMADERRDNVTRKVGRQLNQKEGE